MLVVHVKAKEPLETHTKSHVGEPFIYYAKKILQFYSTS